MMMVLIISTLVLWGNVTDHGRSNLIFAQCPLVTARPSGTHHHAYETTGEVSNNFYMKAFISNLYKFIKLNNVPTVCSKITVKIG